MEQMEEEVEKDRVILESTLKNQLDNLKKKVKLPMNMLLANPALVSQNISCIIDIPPNWD